MYIWELLKLLFVMGIMVGAGIWILSKMKEKRNNKTSTNRMIQVVDTIPIGFKDEVNLIKVGNEYILMSATSGQMIALKQTEIERVEEHFEQYLDSENKQDKWKALATTLTGKVMKR